MKKLFTLLLTLGSFSAVFAQGGHDNNRNNSRYDQRGNEVAMNNHGRDYQNSNVYNYPSSRGNDDRGRQQQIDRRDVDYGRRGNDYGYGQPQPSYDRERRMNEMQRGQRPNNGSFVKGAVVGGLAGVLLGVLLSK